MPDQIAQPFQKAYFEHSPNSSTQQKSLFLSLVYAQASLAILSNYYLKIKLVKQLHIIRYLLDLRNRRFAKMTNLFGRRLLSLFYFV
tara:strand:+ start:16503 stop:16763 length:261 start_codon:yes stop_codon:yes gene_type:complete